MTWISCGDYTASALKIRLDGECNRHTDTVPLEPEDVSIAFGYTPQPPGPWTPAEGLVPLTLLPGQAVDLTLTWAWAGEPYAALRVGVYRYAVQLE